MRPATWRAVAAESVRPRWPWPKAKTMRGSRGCGADDGKRIGRRRAGSPSIPGRRSSGRSGQVAARLLAHGGGAREIRRRVDGGKFDGAADAQAIVQRRGDEAVRGEEHRHRDRESGIGERGVVAALGLEMNAEAELAHKVARPDAAGDHDTIEAALGPIGGEHRDLVAVRQDAFDGGRRWNSPRAATARRRPVQDFERARDRPLLRREKRAREAAARAPAPWLRASASGRSR